MNRSDSGHFDRKLKDSSALQSWMRCVKALWVCQATLGPVQLSCLIGFFTSLQLAVWVPELVGIFFFPIWMIKFSKSPKGFGEVNLCSSKQVLLDFVFELREIISISEMTVNIKGPQWKRQPLTLTRIMSYYRNIILSANPLFKKIQRLGRCSKEFREISQSKAEIHSLKQ